MLFRRGTRTFVVASVLTMAIGILHTAGLSNEPPNEAYAAAMESMKAASLTFEPFEMTLWGAFESVWIQVGIFLVLLGVKNIVVVATASSRDVFRQVRVLSAADCGVYAAFTGMFVYYQIPPPLLSYAVLTILFFASAIIAGKLVASER